MKKIIVSSFICLLIGCNENEDNDVLYNGEGIPDEGQSFSCMLFIDDNEGYLFGTLNKYQEMSESDSQNPNYIAKSISEANVYKTFDGGYHWVKVDSIPNYS